jgi:hypothetical protein
VSWQSVKSACQHWFGSSAWNRMQDEPLCFSPGIRPKYWVRAPTDQLTWSLYEKEGSSPGSGMESWKQTLAELSRDRLASLKRQAFLLCGNDGQA